MLLDATTASKARYAGRIHPPKREIFDVAAGTNTDNKGFVRAVDIYTQKPWGLYVARPTPGRAQFRYLESWLLPTLNLRATVFHWNPGHEREQDYYLDVVDITGTSGTVWHTEDHYLDLVVRTGQGTELVDVDELLAAHRMGLISSDVAEQAIRAAVAAVEGLAGHDHDLHSWLASNAIELTWR